MIKKLIVLLLLAAPSLWAQEESDFEEFGKTLFEQMTDPEREDAPEFIRTHMYTEVIQEQPVGDNQKVVMEHEMNEGYNKIYDTWARSLDELKEAFQKEALEGARYEYLTTRYWPVKGSEHIYEMETEFVYRKGNVQNSVSLRYDVAWVSSFQSLIMISPLKEDF